MIVGSFPLCQYHCSIIFVFQLAETEMLTLDADEREMNDLRRELAVYFCEDEESFRLDECISIFNTFCQKFLKAIEVG
jgi:hypothetical protein